MFSVTGLHETVTIPSIVPLWKFVPNLNLRCLSQRRPQNVVESGVQRLDGHWIPPTKLVVVVFSSLFQEDGVLSLGSAFSKGITSWTLEKRLSKQKMQEPDKHWTHVCFDFQIVCSNTERVLAPVPCEEFSSVQKQMDGSPRYLMWPSLFRWCNGTIRQTSRAFVLPAETACAPLAEKHTFA